MVDPLLARRALLENLHSVFQNLDVQSAVEAFSSVQGINIAVEPKAPHTGRIFL